MKPEEHPDARMFKTEEDKIRAYEEMLDTFQEHDAI
jgi:hypothetical protein